VWTQSNPYIKAGVAGQESIKGRLANYLGLTSSGSGISSKRIVYSGDSTVQTASYWYSTVLQSAISGGFLSGISARSDMTNIIVDASSNVTVTTTNAIGTDAVIGQLVSITPMTGATQCMGEGIVSASSGTQFTFQIQNASSCVSVLSTASTGYISKQVLNFGNNGMALSVMLADSNTAHAGIGGVCAAIPDLVIYRWGINDVRQGATSLAQLIALYRQLIAATHACSPLTDIILKAPNGFLTTDVGSNGYVVPNGSAQAYSTILLQAADFIAQNYPDVVVIDEQGTIFGTVSQATSTYMGDQIHPSTSGYAAEANQDLQILAFLQSQETPAIQQNPLYSTLWPQFDPYLSRMAVAQSYSAPWTVYPHACEDPYYYDLIAYGTSTMAAFTLLAPGQTYLRLSFPTAAASYTFDGGDVVEQWSAGCWALSPNLSTQTSAGNTQINLGSSQTTPYTVYPAENINIWRPKFYNVAAETYYRNPASYPYRRRVELSGGGSGYFQIYFQPSEGMNACSSNVTTSDTLVLGVDGTTVSLSGCTLSCSAANLQCNKAGTYTSYVGEVGWIFGTHPMEGQPDSTNMVTVGHGTKPTVTGCGTIATQSGNALAGTFVSALASCVPVLTALPPAPIGYNCSITDQTLGTGAQVANISSTVTSATFPIIATTSGDVMAFSCQRY
jgi:hypothetical protein